MYDICSDKSRVLNIVDSKFTASINDARLIISARVKIGLRISLSARPATDYMCDVSIGSFHRDPRCVLVQAVTRSRVDDAYRGICHHGPYDCHGS